MKNAHMFFVKYDNNASRCVKNNCIIVWGAAGGGRHLLCSPDLEVWAEISYQDAWTIMKMNLDEVEIKYKEETVLCTCFCEHDVEVRFTKEKNKVKHDCPYCGAVFFVLDFATMEVEVKYEYEEDAVCGKF